VVRVKRLIDVAVAASVLVLGAPVLAATAALVYADVGRPVLFRQPRVGRGNRVFELIKFRTMKDAVDREGRPLPDGERLGRIGRLLRASSLDELPQLINVLRGDMNVVGPRPEQPRIFTHLRHQIDNYADRQRVLPGITGLAQVRQHYDNSIDDVRRKLMFDLQYIDNRSVGQDLKVLFQTLPVVVFQKGAW